MPGGKSFLARRVSSLSGGVDFAARGGTLKTLPQPPKPAIRSTIAARASLSLFMGSPLSVSQCDVKTASQAWVIPNSILILLHYLQLSDREIAGRFGYLAAPCLRRISATSPCPRRSAHAK